MRPRGRFKCKNNALGIYYKNNFDHLLNIRPPHFASKVSYSASPLTFAACSCSAPCSCAATAILFGQKLRRDFLEQ